MALFDFYGAPDAEIIIIAMGSVCIPSRNRRLPESSGIEDGHCQSSSLQAFFPRSICLTQFRKQ